MSKSFPSVETYADRHGISIKAARSRLSMLAALEMYWSKLGPRGTWDPHAHEWLGIVENGQPITEEFHVSPKGAFLVTIWIPVQKSGLAEWSVWVDNRKIAQGECATEDEAKKISLAVAMAVPL